MGNYFEQSKNVTAAFSWVARFNSHKSVVHQLLLAVKWLDDCYARSAPDATGELDLANFCGTE